MATIVIHHRVRIVTLQPEDDIASCCRSGDIAIVQDKHGWWTHFIGDDGDVQSYDSAFDSYNKALWAAKAAAEFETGSE